MSSLALMRGCEKLTGKSGKLVERQIACLLVHLRIPGSKNALVSLYVFTCANCTSCRISFVIQGSILYEVERR